MKDYLTKKNINGDNLVKYLGNKAVTFYNQLNRNLITYYTSKDYDPAVLQNVLLQMKNMEDKILPGLKTNLLHGHIRRDNIYQDVNYIYADHPVNKKYYLHQAKFMNTNVFNYLSNLDSDVNDDNIEQTTDDKQTTPSKTIIKNQPSIINGDDVLFYLSRQDFIFARGHSDLFFQLTKNIGALNYCSDIIFNSIDANEKQIFMRYMPVTNPYIQKTFKTFIVSKELFNSEDSLFKNIKIFNTPFDGTKGNDFVETYKSLMWLRENRNNVYFDTKRFYETDLVQI